MSKTTRLPRRTIQRLQERLQKKLEGKERKIWLPALKLFLGKEDPWQAERKEILVQRRHIFLSIEIPFNSQDFFNGPAAPYVDEYFREQILACVGVMRKSPGFGVNSQLLTENLSDVEITQRLPDHYLFNNASDFCACLAAMINRQQYGQAGELLANGYGNIFYVSGKAEQTVAANLYWGLGRHEWFLFAAPLATSIRRAGSRIFFSSRRTPGR